jgi:uncharacterized protein
MEERRMTDTGPQVDIADSRLREAIPRLVGAYAPQRIYLFGSAGRGDGDEDSDYDLMVVLPDSVPASRRRSRIGYEALRGTGTAADVLVCTASYFDSRSHLAASLPGTILREGRLLYGA